MLDNALVRQKDHILNLVRDGKYEEALILLDFAADLWNTCTYSYKTAEIKEIVRNELRAKKEVCAHWKQHEKWDKILKSIR